MLAVLDNVRADRLDACGYKLPTSPFLSSLCESGAACSCGAEAPSTWTLPSHASFFTGTELPQHGATMVASHLGETDLPWAESVRPLGDELPTLAELMKERGYQTVLLSANPVVSEATGLTRGFDVSHSATRFQELYGAPFARTLNSILREQVDPDEPLFLFVNVADAHQPWLAVPRDVGWVRRRPRLSFEIDLEQGNERRRAYMNGELNRSRAAHLRGHLRDVYDYSVFRADRTLQLVWSELQKAGWLHGGFRMVITSDHGEHLGEHSLLGHAGPFVYETLTRVPIVMHASTPPPELPEQLSAIDVFDLTLEGELRGSGRPIRAAAFASDSWARWFGPRFGRHPGAAIWLDREKLVWQKGEYYLFDLEADPEERKPRLLGDHPERDQIEALAKAIEVKAKMAPEPTEEAERLLRSLGYLD